MSQLVVCAHAQMYSSFMGEEFQDEVPQLVERRVGKLGDRVDGLGKLAESTGERLDVLEEDLDHLYTEVWGLRGALMLLCCAFLLYAWADLFGGSGA